MKFDVVYHGKYATIEPHISEDGSEGFTFEEACQRVAAWHEKQAHLWADYNHVTARYFLKESIKKVDP